MAGTAPVTVEVDPDARAFYESVYGDAAQGLLDKIASRPAMPDVDLDFEQEGRASVRDWIRDRYPVRANDQAAIGVFAHELLEQYFTLPAAARWADMWLGVTPPTARRRLAPGAWAETAARDADVERKSLTGLVAAQLPPLPRYERIASVIEPELGEVVKYAYRFRYGVDAIWTMGDLVI